MFWFDFHVSIGSIKVLIRSRKISNLLHRCLPQFGDSEENFMVYIIRWLLMMMTKITLYIFFMKTHDKSFNCCAIWILVLITKSKRIKLWIISLLSSSTEKKYLKTFSSPIKLRVFPSKNFSTPWKKCQSRNITSRFQRENRFALFTFSDWKFSFYRRFWKK